jgi:hypothetical protein
MEGCRPDPVIVQLSVCGLSVLQHGRRSDTEKADTQTSHDELVT